MIAQLLSGWRGVAAFALLGASIAASTAWEVRGWRDASLMSDAKAAQARAEQSASDVRLALANSIAELERRRADEQAKALDAVKTQTRRLLELQTRLAESERDRIKISEQLKEGLTHVPFGDARDLGPAVLRSIDRVRFEQRKP
jgi:hypothetical protein